MPRSPGVYLILTVGLFAACGTDTPAVPASDTASAAPVDAEVEWFVDQAEATGLDYIHFNGMTGGFYTPEMMGPGVGLFDYDNDGDLDVYIPQGELLGEGEPLITPPEGQPLTDRLFRNELEVHPDGTRTLRFTDVTNASGLRSRGYGIGVATGDYDNDGWVDLYVTRFGPNQLFRNLGDGTFLDVSATSGTDDASWGAPATFLDYDRDGFLDLFVGNYLAYTLETHTQCYAPSGVADYCAPESGLPQSNVLYRNQGNGTFVDVTVAAGLARDFGPALGNASADFNNDGWIDLFVANDQMENQLWINQQDGTFQNMALLSGAALGAGGNAKADMGVDAGDFDNDGDEDLFITELTGQGSTLYVNDGRGLFEDLSAPRGIRGASLPYTGFGAAWIDIDNDGWQDIIAVNGTVTTDIERLSPENPFPLDQRNQVFQNRRDGSFEDVTDQAGGVFNLSEVSRGAAFGDLDNDGDTDLIVANTAGPARLLINAIGQQNHWLGLELIGRQTPRDMLGARVAVMLADGSTLWRRARADGSYASANDPRVLVGLAEVATTELRLRVTWPSGLTEEWLDLPINQYTTLTEGTGGSLSP